MPKVPVINYPKLLNKKQRQVLVNGVKEKSRFAFGHEDRVLKVRLNEINTRIILLKAEREEVVKALKNRESLRRKESLQPVTLYALRLEDGCYYIGMSHNVEKRFVKHQKGKGAVWTKLHKPLEIIEQRKTVHYSQDLVAKLEDDMTLEYAMLYGSCKVRGGGYCQQKPRWPQEVMQNEMGAS